MKEYDFPYVWIERKRRSKCLEYSAPATGIRVTYDKDIDIEVIEEIGKLINYLRKNYYFPVRVNVIFTNHEKYRSGTDGHLYSGIFYDNVDVYPKRKIYPQIYIAGQIWKNKSTDYLLFVLLHELTHYFQWFFAEDENRTSRSLEREANDWAHYILQCFKEQKQR